MTEFNGEVWFRANDGTSTGMWKCTMGDVCSKVNDTISISTSSAAPPFVVFADRLVFAGSEGTFGTEPYSCTAAGECAIMTDIRPGTSTSNPQEFTVAGDRLYMQASPPGFISLFSCGTDFQCSQHPNSLLNARNLRAFKGEVYMSANRFGNEPVRCDESGCENVQDLNPGSAGSSWPQFYPSQDALYLTAEVAGSGRELYSYVEI